MESSNIDNLLVRFDFENLNYLASNFEKSNVFFLPMERSLMLLLVKLTTDSQSPKVDNLIVRFVYEQVKTNNWHPLRH